MLNKKQLGADTGVQLRCVSSNTDDLGWYEAFLPETQDCKNILTEQKRLLLKLLHINYIACRSSMNMNCQNNPLVK